MFNLNCIKVLKSEQRRNYEEKCNDQRQTSSVFGFDYVEVSVFSESAL